MAPKHSRQSLRPFNVAFIYVVNLWANDDARMLMLCRELNIASACSVKGRTREPPSGLEGLEDFLLKVSLLNFTVVAYPVRLYFGQFRG